MIASGVRYCCASRIQELLLKFKISLAITLLHLLLTTAGKAQDGFLGKYKAVFKTACEEAWTLSPGISVPPLKEFTICLYLKLLTSSDPWTAFVYVKETPESIQSVKKYELGLTGDGNKLTVWLFGYHIDLTENFHLDDLQQVCIEWKSTDNEMKLFINGRKKRSRKLDGKLEKLTLDGNGQFLLGCSQPSRTASSSAVGMVGELYMFRMWDKADIKLSHDCIDGSVISWRRKYWAYNHTIEESNTLPCDTNSEDTTDSAVDAVKSNLPVATTIADTASEEITHTSETINGLDLNTSTTSDTTSEETTHSRGTLSENIIINTVQPLPTNINETEPNHLCNSSVICNDSVFYMGKVKFQSSEEINTSLNVEIINNISSKQVTKLIPLATHTLQDPTISEFNKTLQKISESSVMECAAENQSLPVCSFIIKVARTMNISNSMATVRGNMEISQIGDTTRATINASTPEDIVSEMEKALSAGNLEPKVAEKMVNSISGLLNSSVSIPSSMSKRIIQLVDTIGLRLNFSTKSINFTSPSLALAVIKVNSSSFSKMSFAVQDSSDLQITLGIQAPTNNVGAITLPSSLLMDLPSEETDLASRIIFNFYEKTTVFQDPSLENLSLISKVISSSVANLTVNNLKANVTVTLQNTRPYQDNLTVRCAFWDFNKNSGQGGWSSEGCTVKERTPNETVCSCNHLTSFAVLLDLSRNTTLSAKQELVLTFISYIGCGLSAVFLSVTLVTYVAFEKLRRDYPSKILIQLCAALLLLNLVFLLDSWIALYNVRGLCITVAVFLHYFLLVSFTWMGLEAFHMYLALVKVFNTYIRKYILKFCIVGWGVPAVIVAIVLAITPDNYGLGSYGKFPNGTPDEFCWINSSIAFYITVVGYFCMIFLLNVSMFIVVLIQLCRIKKKKQLGTQRKTSIQDLRSVAGLTFLLGITWGFAFFAWGPVNLIFMYLFAIFNTLQGFFIFIFYCVAKENVRKQWRRYLCCGKFRLAENSDWSRTATNGLKKQTVNQGVSSSSNSLQSNSNSTNSTTLLMNNDYSVHANGNGHLPSEKNGVSFNVQNGDVRLHDFSGKQLIFYEKDETDNKNSRISLRRTSKRGSLHFIERM
uniref:Adhesion G-protein coupled receptor G2 n=1 Tax=Crocodylus porosus TaxID=8502 RepID=A0A7M4ECC1_CROPO